ncbi:DUF3040 domain-containing protein [Actinophytocola sp. NPDC049390]|uniref:DUF3040 domain-containing protein n=1 Tax=Actinophytocola sp. NPDC049390 TaxID=3363894 RepID=UPI00378E73C2
MLSDAERQALQEMQRHLSVEDPDFVRLFDFPKPRARPARRRRPRLSRLVAEMIAALTIMDPQPLTDSQIAALHALPAPRRRPL